MITTLESAQTEFISILGAPRVVTDEAICRSLAVDGQAPASVVYPESPDQVAAVLKCAADRGLAVIPCRSGTKLGVGNRPRRYDVALSLKDLNNVRHYEPADLTVSVEPGLKLADFERLLERDGLWLPLDPPGGDRASMGGTIATNATGPLRLLYGSPRDMVLGMKIATAEGKIVNTGGRVVKNVAGYDLSKLLIGSYGTLGVIVGVNLKLFPLPAERATFAFGFSSLKAAADLRRRILGSQLTPMRMTFVDAQAARLLLEHPSAAMASGDSEIWVEAGGSKRVVERYERALEELGVAAGATVNRLELAKAQQGWSRIVDFRSCIAAAAPDVVILRAALPIAESEAFVARARQECEKAKLQLATIAQVGVGVVHTCLLNSSEISAMAAVIQNLRDAARDLRGALVMERCSTELKGLLDVWGPPGDDFEIMSKLKQVWDPKGILSPGRFVGSL